MGRQRSGHPRAHLHADNRHLQPDQRFAAVADLRRRKPGHLHRHRRRHGQQLRRHRHRHAGKRGLRHADLQLRRARPGGDRRSRRHRRADRAAEPARDLAGTHLHPLRQRDHQSRFRQHAEFHQSGRLSRHCGKRHDVQGLHRFRADLRRMGAFRIDCSSTPLPPVRMSPGRSATSRCSSVSTPTTSTSPRRRATAATSASPPPPEPRFPIRSSNGTRSVAKPPCG